MIRRAFGLVLLFGSLLAPAQTPKLEPGTSRPIIPTVTFTLDWPTAHPPYYSIAIDSTGRGAYTAVDDKSSGGEPYMEKFEVSRPVRDRIFAAAEALDYFQGKFDFTGHKIASTGTKTLSYLDPKRHTTTTYNWSQNKRLMELTDLFIGLNNTIVGGRKLVYDLRFDHLGLNDTLKGMEDQAKDNYLAEVHVIQPILQQIADDPEIMNVARQRARRLLGVAAAEMAAPTPSVMPGNTSH